MSEDSEQVEIQPANGWKSAAIIEALVIYFLSVALSFLIGKVYF